MSNRNPTFKLSNTGPSHAARSPSPPRRFVEPLSPPAKPARPAPVEPHFNYPAINDNVHFTVRPDQATYAATPKSRIRASSHKSGHYRTPSTIDTLAEAALALSPPYPSRLAGARNGHSHAHPASHGHGMSEPPHKRARSEVLPTSMVSQFASRPATSYNHGQTWHSSSAQHGSYDSRIEEASLLLNFRTGGLPANNHSLRPPTAGSTIAAPPARQHANSFPRATYQPRPVELASQAGLLPAFSPQYHGKAPSTLPSPQQTIEDFDESPKPPGRKSSHVVEAVGDTDFRIQHGVNVSNPLPQQIQTPPDELEDRATSSAPSTSAAMGDSSETTVKYRRGWPRGKPRAASSRKVVTGKPAARRTVKRKKTLDASEASRDVNGDEVNRSRRKSSSDVIVTSTSPKLMALKARAKSVPPTTSMIIRPMHPVRLPRRTDKAIVEVVVCAGCETTRETTSLNGQLDEWISCNGCKKWFHVDCAGFQKASEVRDVDRYFCTKCEPVHGKTTYVRKSTRAHASVDYAELQRGVLKTSEESVEHHYVQHIKDGTFQFDPETFPRMRPELLSRDFFEKSGVFVEPICIPAVWNPRPWLAGNKRWKNRTAPSETDDDVLIESMPDDFEYDAVPDEGQDKLDMVMPEELTVRQVCNLVGADVPLDVIDVKTQNSGAKWTLGRWADYYEEKTDDKPIRNVISLEVSQTKLGRLLRRPKVVRDIDLQDEVWPQKELDLGKWPKVQYYCLMSAADSFTDFHIDFGGSSVYYHILKGKKTFFFIPPKTKHLKAYEDWNDSPEQNYTFLPNITKECYRVDLSEGDTMLIPSGWIHAVWTPQTSLVIGGNFLSRMFFTNQFRVVEIEKNNNTPMKFRYPFFQKIMWYTTIQYLEQDPLPDAVAQLFHEGRQFERQAPVWADFEGELAANDGRPGANNTRYYSQAEIEGLPELCNYIFRTVMLVMGRVEGISADRMKRVNASIPKGHGDPLEVAKTFALWVAWKRGNEDIPAWAHPDAVLPNSKEEGAPKKLSARALKEMERKEAVAAWRAVPDRQSARVKNATAATAAASAPAIVATPERTWSYPLPSTQQPSNHTHDHQMGIPQAPIVAQPMQLMMSGIVGQHISTPKTSVLGPKRVACDACRKRRIKCKHKDLVMQVTPDSLSVLQLSPEEQDHILVTPPKPQPSTASFITDIVDTQQNAPGIYQPGTNAYLGANISIAMTGSAMFGDSGSKRGRSKACFECRKSKRRCIHDDTGNVDPIKAAETPVPRGSLSSKKRFADDSTPVQVWKKQKASSPAETASTVRDQTPHTLATGASRPLHNYQPFTSQPHASMTTSSVSGAPQEQPRSSSCGQQYPLPREHEQQQSHEHQHQQCHIQQPAALDPNLFSSYPDPAENGSYGNSSYPYPSQQHSTAFQLQSLEQIANDVLDLNGQSLEDEFHTHHDASTTHHGLRMIDNPRPDESVDSAVSLPGSDDEKSVPNQQIDSVAYDTSRISPVVYHGSPLDGASEETHHPAQSTGAITDLPLYRPPPPPSQSPEQSKRQPLLTNGVVNCEVNGVQLAGGVMSEDAKKDLELARLLQQDDLGLRKRGS